MARRIIDAGFPTTLWARRPESLEPFARHAPRRWRRRPAELGRRLRRPRRLRRRRRRRRRGAPRPRRRARRRWPTARSSSSTAPCTPTTCLRLQEDFPDLHVLDAPVSGGGHKAADGRAARHGRRPGRGRRPVPARAGDLRRPGPPPRAPRRRAGGEGPQQHGLRRPAGAGRRGLRARRATGASTGRPSPTSSSSGSGRSYAAEVVTGSGFDLEGLAPFAGELLAKDVGILVDRAGLDRHRAARRRRPGARPDGRGPRSGARVIAVAGCPGTHGRLRTVTTADATVPSASALRLVLAAERLFARHGIDGVSLRQIAAEAGSGNNSAVHYHFGSKHGLIAAIFRHRLPQIISERRLLAARCDPDDLRSRFEAHFLPVLTMADATDNHYVSFVEQIQRTDLAAGRRPARPPRRGPSGRTRSSGATCTASSLTSTSRSATSRINEGAGAVHPRRRRPGAGGRQRRRRGPVRAVRQLALRRDGRLPGRAGVRRDDATPARRRRGRSRTAPPALRRTVRGQRRGTRNAIPGEVDTLLTEQ